MDWDLTEDDLTTAGGQRDQLVGAVQTRYGIAKAAAEKQIDEWAKNIKGAM